MRQDNSTTLPLVSIAMATYNGEKYLKEQLDSIYAQTHSLIEVIVTDDCSSDKTVEILNQYSKSHGLKYFVNETNLGFVKNFEKAISLCQGDYIALADQDDIWLPHKISTLLSNLGDHTLIASDASLIDENNQPIASSFEQYASLYIPPEIKWENFVFNNFVTGCTVLFKKELIRHAFPFQPEMQMHDWWLAEIAAKEFSVHYLRDQLIQYRQHSSSVTGIPTIQSSSLEIFHIYKRIRNRSESSRYNYAQKQLTRLSHHLSLSIYSSAQRKILKDAYTYYEDYINHIFHYKRFWLALRYYDYIGHQNKSCTAKIKFLFNELIG